MTIRSNQSSIQKNISNDRQKDSYFFACYTDCLYFRQIHLFWLLFGFKPIWWFMTSNQKKTKSRAELITALRSMGADHFIENSCLVGETLWSQSDVISAINYVHTLATHPFFQDKENFKSYHGVSELVDCDDINMIRGHTSSNIANTLMAVPAFLESPMAFDFDFLNQSFDGVNTPGMFGMMFGGDKWFVTLQHKHGLNFAEIMSKLYTPPASSEPMFGLSKQMTDFITNIDHYFELTTKRPLTLFASLDYADNPRIKTPIEFVSHQLEALSVLHVAYSINDELHNYSALATKPDSAFFIESIEALKAFHPNEKEKIHQQLISKSENLLLPEDIRLHIIHSQNEFLLSNALSSIENVEFPESTPAQFY